MIKIENAKKPILFISFVLEYLLAFILIVSVFLGIFDTLRIIYTTYIVNFSRPIDYSQLNYIFAQILLLVIGVEIAIMLALHKHSALLEVLLYGIARKMLLLPKNHGMTDVILGVISIGLLFIIQKYLISKNNDISPSFKDDDDND
nr:phosphate-starvation-inducible PsiE family protein [uncultured Peptostreptococcus sp.]